MCGKGGSAKLLIGFTLAIHNQKLPPEYSCLESGFFAYKLRYWLQLCLAAPSPQLLGLLVTFLEEVREAPNPWSLTISKTRVGCEVSLPMMKDFSF